MISTEFLRKVQVFEGLQDEQLDAVRGICQEKRFHRGMRIFGEGETATFLCAVMEGKIDLRFDRQGRPTAKENTIASLTEGDTFGWSSFVPPHAIRLSSYCESESCRVLMMDRGDLTRLFEQDALIGYRVMANLALVIGSRFHKLQDEAVLHQGFEVASGW